MACLFIWSTKIKWSWFIDPWHQFSPLWPFYPFIVNLSQNMCTSILILTITVSDTEYLFFKKITLHKDKSVVYKVWPFCVAVYVWFQENWYSRIFAWRELILEIFACRLSTEVSQSYSLSVTEFQSVCLLILTILCRIICLVTGKLVL